MRPRGSLAAAPAWGGGGGAWGAAAAPAWGAKGAWGKGAPAAKGATYGGKPVAAAQWAPPPKDPPPWAQAEGKQGELLWKAVPEAVAGFAHLELEWEPDKLEKKIRDYFNKASKNIQFRGRTLQQCVDEYTDNAMGSLFASMGDREWLYKGQADFVLLLDAGIKDSFPGQLLWTAEHHEFEQMVLTSYERAFDENRFGPALSETVKDKIQGPKSKKKVWNALDAGRKLALAEGTASLEAFVSTWISRSLELLTQAAGGNPADVMSSAQATELFQALLDGGTLPLALTAEHGEPPSPMPLVDETVQAVYAPLEAAAALAEAEAEEAKAAKRQRVSE